MSSIRSKTLVAVMDDGRPPVGFVELRGNHVSNLMVDPCAQGHGVGAALLAAAEARVEGNVTPSVFTVNPRARAFCERLGYVHFGEKTIVFLGSEERIWCLIKHRTAERRTDREQDQAPPVSN